MFKKCGKDELRLAYEAAALQGILIADELEREAIGHGAGKLPPPTAPDVIAQKVKAQVDAMLALHKPGK